MTVLRTVIKKKTNNRNYSKRIPNQEKSYTSVVSKAVNAPKKFLRTANKTKGKIPPNSLLHYIHFKLYSVYGTYFHEI